MTSFLRGAPPPKKNPGSAPVSASHGLFSAGDSRTRKVYNLCTYQCHAGSGGREGGEAGGGGGGWHKAPDLIDHFGPWVGHLNYLAVGMFEFLFVPVTTNHFLGCGISVYSTSHFCPGVGNLPAIFGKMSKSCSMPRLFPP